MQSRDRHQARWNGAAGMQCSAEQREHMRRSAAKSYWVMSRGCTPPLQLADRRLPARMPAPMLRKYLAS